MKFEIDNGLFIWNTKKEILNIRVHKLSFASASQVFSDPRRLIAADEAHSKSEERLFCIGRTSEGRIATVRFTYRGHKIRIIGAGY